MRNRPKTLIAGMATAVLSVMTLAGPGLAGEAPELAAMVAAGTLPPLEERLPLNPRVIDVVEEIGTYGGTMTASMVGGRDHLWLVRLNSWEGLIAWTRDFSGEIIPNVAESFEVNDNATEFTFKLREGMKWSDGAPFGVDDVEFYLNDVMLNTDLTAAGGSEIWPQDNQPAFERIDDMSFKFVFERPFGLFPGRISAPQGGQMTAFPKHYCSQFHIKYNPNADADATAAGLASWSELFAAKCPRFITAERAGQKDIPVITAWMYEVPLVGGSTTGAVMVRNPYYWKVDAEGNQLPYIDRHEVGTAAEAQTVILRAANGELSYQDRHINAPINRALFLESAAAGDFRVVNTMPEDANSVYMSLNLSHKDENMRAIFQNKDFRVALSHAIDRQAIIEAVFLGFGEPAQVSPQPGTIYYDEELAKQYTEYDPALAAQILDGAGFTLGSDGFRVDSNGKRITFVCDTVANNLSTVAATELIVQYWQAIGVDARINVGDRQVLGERLNANDSDCYPWPNSQGSAALALEAYAFVPTTPTAHWGIGFYQWTYGGPLAVEPPARLREALDIYKQVEQEPNDEARIELMKQVLQIAKEEFWTIGVSTQIPSFAVVKNNLHNVPDPGINAWTFLSPAVMNTEQFFFKQ